jgi:AraC-like DNA-binding protein
MRRQPEQDRPCCAGYPVDEDSLSSLKAGALDQRGEAGHTGVCQGGSGHIVKVVGQGDGSPRVDTGLLCHRSEGSFGHREVYAAAVGEGSNPVANDARRRLVDVLHDEICSASQIELHLPVPRDPALKRLATLLAEDPRAGKDLATLAREAGLSERSLFRNFQKETGLSPGQWRRQMQVLRSLELLSKGRSVTETSFEVGYESTGAFIRAFRQTIGVTPTVFTREQRSSSSSEKRLL